MKQERIEASQKRYPAAGGGSLHKSHPRWGIVLNGLNGGQLFSLEVPTTPTASPAAFSPRR